MLWFKKNSTSLQDVSGERIHPATLAIELDSSICQYKLEQLMAGIDERGGLDGFIEALQAKHRLFSDALAPEVIEELGEDGFALLLDAVFPARRKLPIGLTHVPHDVLLKQLQHLLHGEGAVNERLQAFCQLFADDNRKVQRAAWDFAAETLHFYAPGQYPLMARWVWDMQSVSGALREFIRANDSLPEIPITNDAGQFEAGRVWLAEQLSEQGYYRDVPFIVDMLLAQAYADYFIAMSSGVGMMAGEFGGKIEAIDFISKLLGIEPSKRSGKLRVKQETLH